MSSKIATVLVGLFLLPAISLAQTAEDLDRGCSGKAEYETERDSCEIAHFYTTRNFLARCKGTQERLLRKRIPEKEGCLSDFSPNVIFIETDANGSEELKRIIRTEDASAFRSATRLQVTHYWDFENRTQKVETSVLSRLDNSSNKAELPKGLLSSDEVPTWLRSVAQKLYKAELPKYNTARKARIEEANRRFELQFPELATHSQSRKEVAQNDPSVLRDVSMPGSLATTTREWLEEIVRAEEIAELEFALELW